MRIPRATYRLQFNRNFRLADAVALVPYLYTLGVSHIYASPLFKAAPGSSHGYDVCDYSLLNPEIGTEADLQALSEELHRRNMGLVLDIVPNHMGIASRENHWWWDVLSNGQQSKFARHFDIDWNPADCQLHGKVLVPVLGDDYQRVLERGELMVRFENGEFVLAYFEHRLPLAPATVGLLEAEGAALANLNEDYAELDRLIQKQHYLLACHEEADSRINYRRFFAVSTLAAVRQEQESTFAATHQLLRRWLDLGFIDGLRIDHPDGLRAPETYLRRLRKLAPDAWIVVEKILEPGEKLPRSWPVQGTTGYDFVNELNGVFLDPASETVLTDFYALLTGKSAAYAAMLAEKKRLVLATLLAAELNRLMGLLQSLATRNAPAHDFTDLQLKQALTEVIAFFPVYRSYISDESSIREEDLAVVKTAVRLASENRTDLPPDIFAFIQEALIFPAPDETAREFVARFQQLTGAVMAKGAEDTAFYCFNRFVSLNEVGGNPQRFGATLEEFHQFIQRQAGEWPFTQVAASTHDTKRSEDVRARLDVLSEIPGEWTQFLSRWSATNERHRQNGFPDRNAEYLLYQTVVGAWPITEDRLQGYMEKASHEAKEHTDWVKKNPAYEAALRTFISSVLADPAWIHDLERLVDRISEAAQVNSLSQTLIRLTVPGVPDIYQGCEIWDFSLVDPDNRRPVDFALRRELQSAVGQATAEETWRRRGEGLPKLFLIQRTLEVRAKLGNFPDLEYLPIFANGAKRSHVVAFARGDRVITVVPRWWLKLNHDWQDTALKLPSGTWRDVFSRRDFTDEIRLNNCFNAFPAMLLIRKESD
jgi:(1->4)-alpha-D-glucan 1-alpha-D-glucosylmutase